MNTNSQGAGPYTLTSYSTTTQVVMTVNPKYWGPKPKYEKIIVRNVQANVQKLNVLKGQSQIAVDLSPAQADGIGSTVQVVNGASPNGFFLFTNNSSAISKITSQPDLQQAGGYGGDYASRVQLAGTGAGAGGNRGAVPETAAGAVYRAWRDADGHRTTGDRRPTRSRIAQSRIAGLTFALGLAVALFGLAATARAEGAYPDKPVRFVTSNREPTS